MKATLIVMGKKYHAEGKTAAEAIGNLNPGRVKGKSILVIQDGDVSRERVLMPAVTYRLFNSAGLTKEIALKHISTLYG